MLQYKTECTIKVSVLHGFKRIEQVLQFFFYTGWKVGDFTDLEKF